MGVDVWKRLKAERRARHDRERLKTSKSDLEKRHADSPDLETGVENLDKRDREKVIYYIHGGAYYVGNAATHRLITIGVSKACNARVFGELPMTPANCSHYQQSHTAWHLNMSSLFHYLTSCLGIFGFLRRPYRYHRKTSLSPVCRRPTSHNVLIIGDSAGGGLGLALCMYLRDEGYKLPCGLILMSPWVDLTMSCGSWDENADCDVVPRPDTDGGLGRQYLVDIQTTSIPSHAILAHGASPLISLTLTPLRFLAICMTSRRCSFSVATPKSFGTRSPF